MKRAKTNARRIGRPFLKGDPGGPGNPHAFRKGNRGGPGNPYAAQIQKLREAGLGVVTPEIFAGIMKRACSDALMGDAQARDFVYDRCVGKAIVPLLVDGQVMHDFSGLARLIQGAPPEEVRMIEAKVIEGVRKRRNGKANGRAKP